MISFYLDCLYNILIMRFSFSFLLNLSSYVKIIINHTIGKSIHLHHVRIKKTAKNFFLLILINMSVNNRVTQIEIPNLIVVVGVTVTDLLWIILHSIEPLIGCRRVTQTRHWFVHMWALFHSLLSSHCFAAIFNYVIVE